MPFFEVPSCLPINIFLFKEFFLLSSLPDFFDVVLNISKCLVIPNPVVVESFLPFKFLILFGFRSPEVLVAFVQVCEFDEHRFPFDLALHFTHYFIDRGRER